jgi:hypothetical protein
MKTCKAQVNGKPCGKPSFADSASDCEEHFKSNYPTTYARIKRQEEENEAYLYEQEMIQKRKGFDP